MSFTDEVLAAAFTMRSARSRMETSSWRPDVEHLADGAGVVEEADEAAHHVGHVAEAPGLGAVAVDGEGLARHRLAHQAGDDHPVGRALAGADGVEQADDRGGQAPLPVVGEGQDLVDRLGRAVRPAGDAGRARGCGRRPP